MLLGELDPEAIGPALEFATHYEPTPLADFDALLKAVPPGFPFSDATFVDIGSGMGRVLMLAAAHAFKQIVGVEISPALHEIARENLARYKIRADRRPDVRLVRSDARDYVFPAGNLLIYLYNPFEGPVFQEVIERLLLECSDDLVLIYHTPTQRDMLEGRAAFTLCADLGCGVVYRKR